MENLGIAGYPLRIVASGRKGKSRGKGGSRRARAFLPDRIVGLLGGIGNALALAIVGGIAGLGGAAAIRSRDRDLIPWTLLFGIAAVVLAGIVWVYAQVFRGRRVGFLIAAVLGAIGIAARSLPMVGGGRLESGSLPSAFLLVYALARLLGWGPRPSA